MRQRDEPLLSSPSHRNAYPCKLLSFTLLSLATVLCLCAGAAFLLLSPTATNLCASSPDPASCQAIVADAVLASPHSHPSRPAHVLRAILATSLDRHDAAAEAVAGMRRRASDPRHRAALEDCVQLMGLARDRLADAAGAPTSTSTSTTRGRGSAPCSPTT